MTVLVGGSIWTTNVRPSRGHFALCRDEKRKICAGICSGLLHFVVDITIWASSLLCETNRVQCAACQESHLDVFRDSQS